MLQSPTLKPFRSTFEMNRNQRQVNNLVIGALIGAVYAAATYLSSAFGVAYGPVQLRLSEALTALAAITPAAVPGLTVGCIIGNIASPMGVWDIVFGALATFIAALLSYKARNIKVRSLPLLSLVMPVIFNALIIGAELAFLMPSSGSRLTAFLINAGQLALSEAVTCLAAGIPLYYGIKRTKIFTKR